jgi:hypothetical protein
MMSLENKEEDNLRVIQTIRGKEAIEKALKANIHLIYRTVVPHRDHLGKTCIVKNLKTGINESIHDFRDFRYRSKEYVVVKDWTYEHYDYNLPEFAAYIIPKDINDNEIVFVEDLIENFLSFRGGQGENKRLVGCKAIWRKNNLEILYDRNRDCREIIG